MKTAVVTGAAGGLGASLCAVLSAEGYRVVATDRRSPSPPLAAAAFVELDLRAACRDSDSLASAVATLRQALAADVLDLLVNNAAVQILGRVEEVSFAAWHETLTVNLTAPFFLAQALLPELERARGTVIHIGSVHDRATKPGFVCYATSKAALSGLTRAMAVDLGPRVRVLAVRPAAIDTEMLRAGLDDRGEALADLAAMHPLARLAQPDEVARVVAFLASRRASFMTGTAIDIDGGILSRLHDPE